MRLDQVPVPDVYTDSADFRFFLKWFQLALTRIKYDTENMLDLYDPLRCPSNLLWMLADTMGFRYDDRLCEAFNRAVLLYFMSMIRNKGSKDGLTLAAEVNLKQFDIEVLADTGYDDATGEHVEPNPVLWNRLEDTTIPVNAASVTPHTDEGYIDVVYFSTRVPTDACTEYVRPLGMYLFSYAGVRFDSEIKLSVDARLTNLSQLGLSLGPTHVGHYRRDDYARLQRISESDLRGHTVSEAPEDTRHLAWFRNSLSEGEPTIDAGYRSLYSLQLSNNEHITQALIKDPEGRFVEPNKFFALGYDAWMNSPEFNLYYKPEEEATHGTDVYTLDNYRMGPAVNPPAMQIGDAISLNDVNSEYYSPQSNE